MPAPPLLPQARPVTALFLVVSTLLAGCLGPEPLEQPDGGTGGTSLPSQPPTRLVACPGGGESVSAATLDECRRQFDVTTQAGPWTVLLERDVVRGARGEIARFWVLVLPNPTAPLSWMVPDAWVRISGSNGALPLTPGGGLFLGEALAGATDRAGFRIVADDPSRGEASVAGPRVEVVGTSTPLPTVVQRDSTPGVAGLWVDIQEQVVTTTFSLGTSRDPQDCGEALRAVGDHSLQRIGSTWTIVGFVERTGGGACTPAQGDRTPRVIARTPSLQPALLQVNVNVHNASAGQPARFPVGGWDEHEALDNVVGPGEPATLRRLEGCRGSGPEVLTVITDAAVFRERWRLGCGGTPPPAINFSNESVVAAFGGPQPPGSTLRVLRVLVGVDHVVVTLERSRPDGAPCPGPPPHEFPADLVATERIERLGRVTFENAEVAPC